MHLGGTVQGRDWCRRHRSVSRASQDRRYYEGKPRRHPRAAETQEPTSSAHKFDAAMRIIGHSAHRQTASNRWHTFSARLLPRPVPALGTLRVSPRRRTFNDHQRESSSLNLQQQAIVRGCDVMSSNFFGRMFCREIMACISCHALFRAASQSWATIGHRPVAWPVSRANRGYFLRLSRRRSMM